MSRKKPRRVIVLQRGRSKEWRVVQADISRDGISVLKAETIPSQLSSRNIPNNAQVVLVSDSDQSVCRHLNLPGASAENTRRMVGVRLESELPYPVEESLWACERHPPGEENPDGSILVFAAPANSIAEADREIHEAGMRCETAMLAEAALAEIAALAADDKETIAIAAVNPFETVFVIAHQGRLHYARRIQSPDSHDLASGKLANELDQCVHHYLLHDNRVKPSRLLVVGEGMHTDGLAAALGDRLGMPVDIPEPPQNFSMAASETLGDELLAKYPICVGALIALHRCLCNQPIAAPPLRLAKPRLRNRSWARRTASIAMTVLLAAGLVYALFAVRAKQLESASRIISQGGTLLGDIDLLRSEQSILKDEMRLRRSTLNLMLALSDVLPKSLKIKSITLDRKGNIAVTGTTPSAEDVSEKAFSAMKECGLFKKLVLHNVTKQKSGYDFRFTCEALTTKGAKQP